MSIAMVSFMHVILTKVFPATRLRNSHLYFLIAFLIVIFVCIYI